VKYYAVYFKPRGALASEIGSDTLFGAVCWALHVLGLTDVGALLQNFSPPRFAFSATFPCYRVNGTTVRFYPRPMTGELMPAQVKQLAQEKRLKIPSRYQSTPEGKAVVEIVEEYKKEIKSATHVSESVFREGVEQGLTTFDLFRRLDSPSGFKSAYGLIYSAKENKQLREMEQPFKTTAVQHNQIDRVIGSTGEGMLFFESETFFSVGVGLWCVVAVDGDETRARLQAAFRYLSDTGLGANRSVGKGHFEITLADEIALPNAGENANAIVSLSRYLPNKGEWNTEHKPLRYEIKTVWGKREQKFPRVPDGSKSPPIYKEPLRMFSPGSIFPLDAPRREVYGRLAQVVKGNEKGEGAVWQSGLMIPVFARAKTEGGM